MNSNLEKNSVFKMFDNCLNNITNNNKKATKISKVSNDN